MKKRLCVFLALLLLVSSAACSFSPWMSREKLLSLDDEAFFEAMMLRCMDQPDGIRDFSATEEQKTYYTLMSLLLEVENGGLCQFFVNTSGECAPFVSEALAQVGASEIKKRYDDFIADNQIDVNDLSFFQTEGRRNYEALTDMFDFDSFDDAFYEDENLYQIIIDYTRENLDKILP